MNKLLHQLRSYSSFSISCGNTNEIIELHNTKKPNTTKSDLELIIDNFDFSQELPINLKKDSINHNEKLDINTIYWVFKDSLKESFKVMFPLSTFIGCEFVNFKDDCIYICIITKNRLFYKKVFNNDVFSKETPSIIETLTQFEKPKNVNYADITASLSTIHDAWCNSKQPLDPDLISSYIDIYDGNIGNDIFLNDPNKDYDFDFIEKVPSFQIRQYVAFDNFICILRDMRDSFEELDTSLFLISDPFGDYHSVQMNTEQHDYVIPMWIDGFVDSFKDDFYLTLLNTENKTTETYHLINKTVNVNEETQWCLKPLVEMPLNNNFSTYLKRASVLQTALNNSDIAGLISAGSIIVDISDKRLLIYYYTIKTENSCILKTFTHEVQDDGIVTFMCSTVHIFSKQILSIDYKYNIEGLVITFADSTIGYSLFFLHDNKLEIKNVVLNKYNSSQKLENCFSTMKLLKLFKCVNLQLNSRYLNIFGILIESILDKNEKMSSIDALFKLLKLNNCNNANTVDNEEIYDVIKLSLLHIKDTRMIFDTLFNILFWYHEELALDTSCSYFRKEIGMKLVKAYTECHTTLACDWKLIYLFGLYKEETNNLKISNNGSLINLTEAVNGTTTDISLSDKDDDLSRKSLMNICCLISLLLIKKGKTGSLVRDAGSNVSIKESLLILDFFEEISNLPHWFNSIIFSRIFKLMHAFMDVASNLLSDNRDETNKSNISMSLDDYYPLSLLQLFHSFSINNEKLLYEINSLNDFDRRKFFLRNDIEKTIKGLKRTTEDGASGTDLISGWVREHKLTSCARTFAYMQPILNNSLFDNKVSYSDREKVKTIAFLRHISKTIGWASLFYNGDNSSLPNNSKRFDIHKINFDIKCGFDEYQEIPCKEKDVEKIISLQFLHMAKFSSGIAKGLSLVKNMHDINDVTISKYRPAKLTPEYGGFMYGLGLNGYLTSWDATSIYYTVVSKFSPVNRGFFLGLGCSNVGSANGVMTKIMLIHLEAVLPRKNLDLNHHYTLQISALLSIGLLHTGKRDSTMAEMLLPLVFIKITVNERRTQNISFNVSAGIAVGLNQLYDVTRIADKNYNDDVDVFNCDILTLADKRNPLCYLSIVICMLLVNLRSKKEHAIKVLEIYMNKEGPLVTDLESKFYLRLFKNMVMWSNNIEGLMSSFNNLQEKSSRLDSLSFENVMLFYEFAADVLSFSIQNVGMCHIMVKKICVKILEDLATLNLDMNNYLKDVDMSYTMKICMKHFFVIRRTLLEALSLNFCSSGDEDITDLCNFYLSSEVDLSADFQNDYNPDGVDLGESIFDPRIKYEYYQDGGNDHRRGKSRPLYYDMDRNYVDVDFMMAKLGKKNVTSRGSKGPSIRVSNPLLCKVDGSGEDSEESSEKISCSPIGHSEGHEEELDEESAHEESDREESDDEAYFDDNFSDDDNVGDKDSIKNKRDFIEKTSYLSDIYADSISASFSLGLLNLSTGRKMVDVSGEQENLAFLILAMLPLVNSFPFELQDMRYFLFMAVSGRNLVCVMNAENDEPMDDMRVELKVEYSDGQEVIKEAPFCIPKLHEVTRLSVVDDQTYYPLSITGEFLLENQSKNDCIKVYVKKIRSAPERTLFKAATSARGEDTSPMLDEVNCEFRKKLREGKDMDTNQEINLFVMTDTNPNFSIDLWDAKNFGV